MIRFPQRTELIRETQLDLGITADGVDARLTWIAIAKALGLSISLPPRPSTVHFEGRDMLVRAVQEELEIEVDGKDGPQTWAALAQEFDPKPIHFPHGNTIATFPESVRGRSPNRNAGTNTCKGIVVHHAAGYFEGTVSWVMRPKTYAAYHCLVAPDGTRAILAQDTDRCHHAGKSTFKGQSSCNNFMLGIAFCGDTNSGAMRPSAALTPQEIASAKEWITTKMKTHGISKEWITHHRVISPGRKDDLSLAAWEQVRHALSLP